MKGKLSSHMSRLPPVNGRDAVKALCKDEFTVVRRRGSHIRLEKTTPNKTIKLTIPDHNPLKRKTLNSILKAAGISKERFQKLL